MRKKCNLCDKIATNREGQQREWDCIDNLEAKEPADQQGVQQSIDIINQLQSEILTLELERRERRLEKPVNDFEDNSRASLEGVDEGANIVERSITDLFPRSGRSPPLDQRWGRDEGNHSEPRVPPSAPRGPDVLQPVEREALRLDLLHKMKLKNDKVSIADTSRDELTSHVMSMSEQWFKEHLAHPYPSKTEKKQLCSSTGLSSIQVRVNRPPCW